MIFVLEINNGQIYSNSQYPFMEWTAGVSIDLEDLIKRGIEESNARESNSFIISAWNQKESSSRNSMMFVKDSDGVWSSKSPYVNKYLGR